MASDFEVLKWRADVADRAESRLLAVKLANRQIAISVITIAISAFGIGITYLLGVKNLETAIKSADRSAGATLESANRAAITAIDISNANLRVLQQSAKQQEQQARKNLENKWRIDLLDEQRKAMQNYAVDFLHALFQALALAQEITSHGRRGESPSSDQIREYDNTQRRNIAAMETSETRIMLENKEMSYLFRPMRARFKQIDNEILKFGFVQDRYPKAVQAAKWCLD